MGIDNTGGFDRTDQDVSLSRDGGAEDGSTGDVMDIWEADRQSKIDNLATTPATNNSSFAVPAAVVDTNNNWRTTQSDAELFHGVSASGTALDADGKPLPGTAAIELNGEVMSETSATGLFTVYMSPPVGVVYGVDTPLDAYDFRFSRG
jgi:hypothetical protein